MKEKRCSIFLFYLALFASVCACHQVAFAQLGESEQSGALNQQIPDAKLASITTRSQYTIRELISPRYAIREYISKSGIIFALAWNGQTRPNLMYLLGTYYPEYEKAFDESIKQQAPLTRRAREVKTDNITVQHWGLPKNLKGRAFAPALIPEGVDVNEIK